MHVFIIELCMTGERTQFPMILRSTLLNIIDNELDNLEKRKGFINEMKIKFFRNTLLELILLSSYCIRRKKFTAQNTIQT